MRTAIFTKDKTTLSIRTFEDLHLVEMRPDGSDGVRTLLNTGDNTVEVGAGVFKIFSTRELRVTGDKSLLGAPSDSSKDDDWPDPAKLTFALNVKANVLHRFFFDARAQPAPR